MTNAARKDSNHVAHVVVDLLGRASINTSAIYAKLDTEARAEAADAMQGLWEKEH